MSLSSQVIVVVLAESQGKGLEPLTSQRTKAAIPFGGKYRMIDFALANCLHSELRRVLVLTQYKSHSLVKHLRDGWSIFNPEFGEYITAVAPQMHAENIGYSGSANAIYQNLFILKRNGAEHILVLPGDTIHRMDYGALLEQHIASGADVTLACKEQAEQTPANVPAISINTDGCINSLHAATDAPADAVYPMGIMAVRLTVLEAELLADHSASDSHHDLLENLLPRLVANHQAHAYQFGGASGRVSQDRYFRDVHSLDDYYNANMALLESEPPLDLYQGDWTIRTYQSQNPPARTVPGRSSNEGIFINSIVGGGTVIAGGGVNNSILFTRIGVEDAATVEHSILFEGVQVGENAQLRNCIVDKYVTIPAGTRIGYDAEADARRFVVSEQGIVVVPKSYEF